MSRQRRSREERFAYWDDLRVRVNVLLMHAVADRHQARAAIRQGRMGDARISAEAAARRYLGAHALLKLLKRCGKPT